MANILDYLDWRGDLLMSADGFNEVDNLVFSQMCYVELDDIIGGIDSNVTHTVARAHEIYEEIYGDIIVNEKQSLFSTEEKPYLALRRGLATFEKMAETERMRDLILTCYESRIDLEAEKQFSAVTFLLPDNAMYVAFRGTDNTIVGWKEDFNMAYSQHVAAQKDAVEYLEKVAKKYPLRKIYVGGHSKGGNLAVYSAVMCKDRLKKRIIAVYNNDGPGFRKEMLDRAEYQEMLPKIHTIVPESSLVGMLLEHKEAFTIVASSASGGLQHDATTWELKGKQFNYLEETSHISQMVDQTLKGWIGSMSDEQMQMLVNTAFDVLEEAQIYTLEDFQRDPVKNAKFLFKAIKDLDEEMRANIQTTLNGFFKESNKAIWRK